MAKIPEFLAKSGWKNPKDALNAPFQLGHQTKQTFFEYLSEEPIRLERFNSVLSSLEDFGVYNAVLEAPWPEILGPVGADEVALVDVGGADGHVLQLILDQFSEIGGTFVLQDLPDTVAKVPADLNKRIKVMEHDFFQPQPVKGLFLAIYSGSAG
jgi:hypothetical protein